MSQEPNADRLASDLVYQLEANTKSNELLVKSNEMLVQTCSKLTKAIAGLGIVMGDAGNLFDVLTAALDEFVEQDVHPHTAEGFFLFYKEYLAKLEEEGEGEEGEEEGEEGDDGAPRIF